LPVETEPGGGVLSPGCENISPIYGAGVMTLTTPSSVFVGTLFGSLLILQESLYFADFLNSGSISPLNKSLYACAGNVFYQSNHQFV
jgi:hypothetical protein